MKQPVDKRRITAALMLNAFVMPGSGHFMLGYRLLGSIIALLTFALLIVAIAAYSSSYFQAVYAIPTGKEFLPRAVEASSMALAGKMYLIRPCLIGVVLLWTFGVADVLFRIRKRTVNTDERNTL